MHSETTEGAILQSVGETDPHPNDVRDAFIGSFVAMASKKFDSGQAEHDGRPDKCNLIRRTNLDDLKQEVIDLWFYIESIEYRLKELGTDL